MDIANGGDSMNRKMYVAGAGILGLAWWATFAVGTGRRVPFLQPSFGKTVVVVLSFTLASMTLAYLFRRLVAGSESRFGTVLSYTVVPFVGGLLTVWWMDALGALTLLLDGGRFPSRKAMMAQLFLVPFLGTATAFMKWWYLVLPMSLLSQVVMHHLGRRCLGVQARFGGVFGTRRLRVA
jgi:hypothetical protein